MIYATEIELIAELVYKHRCQSCDCVCSEIRRLPAIAEEIQKLHKLADDVVVWTSRSSC